MDIRVYIERYTKITSQFLYVEICLWCGISMPTSFKYWIPIQSKWPIQWNTHTHIHSFCLSGGLKTILPFRTLNAIYMWLCVCTVCDVYHTLTKFVYLILPLKLLFICFSGWHSFTLAGFHEFSSSKKTSSIPIKWINMKKFIVHWNIHFRVSAVGQYQLHHTNSFACVK